MDIDWAVWKVMPMPTSLPNLMYHYTTIEVFVSIVERGEIWFSDPRFMNDAREIHHAVEIVCRMIPAIAERHRQAYLDKGLPQELWWQLQF